MKFSPLTEQEASVTGYTHRLDFNYRDIGTGIANNTAKVWGAGFLPALPAGTIINRTELHLTQKFANTGDVLFNSDTISLGDVTTATRFINASEGNLNGAAVVDVTPGANQNVIYTAAGQLQLTLNSMANKSLSNLNQGKAYALMSILNASDPAWQQTPPFGDGNT